MSNYIIETKNLSKIFNKNTVVDSIDLKIEKSKIYGLLGPNGAGKTTTMAMLLNYIKPSSGEIYLFGCDYKTDPKLIYSKIGSIIESPGFYRNLTAYDNLKIFSKLRGNFSRKDIEDALNIVSLDINSKKKFKNFSLGMKQRLGIALALIHNPEVLILDEPINGLDPEGIREIRVLFRKLVNEKKITILISSHILSEIEYIADFIIVMNKGKIIKNVSLDEFHEKSNKYIDFEVSNIDSAIEILKNNSLLKDIDFTIENELIRLYSNLDSWDKIVASFVESGIRVIKINLVEESLEEYYTNLI